MISTRILSKSKLLERFNIQLFLVHYGRHVGPDALVSARPRIISQYIKLQSRNDCQERRDHYCSVNNAITLFNTIKACWWRNRLFHKFIFNYNTSAIEIFCNVVHQVSLLGILNITEKYFTLFLKLNYFFFKCYWML